ncbi:hypothetical protein [Actinokineospora sp.]|uniref:hypothetical protein n=1 Tax=Actinokineospora sp. TaxID=1872133 RepID=UPI003D6C081D
MGSAVLQTLPRTVNTGIGVLFVLGALLILGDDSLADFALALLLGLITGTISTVATAGPVAILLDRRSPEPDALVRLREPGPGRTMELSYDGTDRHPARRVRMACDG